MATGRSRPATIIPVGIDPSGLVVGDFNGDGRPDLAVADAGSDDVEVFLGLGDGTFSDPIVLPVGISPHAIVAGDFLNNGIMDIAVADENSNDVAVLIGRGDGTFLPARFYNVGAEPVALVAADLDGDGYTDLVTANRTSGDLTILWGSAGGNFVAQTDQYGGHAPTALAAGDLTGDGKIDLAVGDQDDQVFILLGLGGRSFAPPSSIDVGADHDFLQVVQSSGNGTGAPLVAAGADSQDCEALMLGRQRLARSEALPSRWAFNRSARRSATSTATASWTSPLATSSSDQVTVLLGNGDGQLLAPEAAAPLPQAAPVVVDWNLDGTSDVFELDQQGQLLLRLGQPGSPGQFEAPQIIGQDLGVAFLDIALVNTRYGPVLAALERGQPVVWLFSLAQGPGGLTEARSIAVPGAALLVSMTAGDLDNDGLDDMVLVDRGNDQLILLYQSPDGTFHEQGPRLDVGYRPLRSRDRRPESERLARPGGLQHLLGRPQRLLRRSRAAVRPRDPARRRPRRRGRRLTGRQPGPAYR